MINSNIIENASSTSKVNAKVELYNGSTLVETCTCNDRLQDFTVERMGQNNKFFGFGVFHRLTVTLIDLERTLEITKGHSFKVFFGYDVEEDFINPYPTFYASEIKRDENTNSITVVAYDKLYAASEYTVSEVTAPYTLEEFAGAAMSLLGVTAVSFENISDNVFSTYYENGANFEGSENYKEALTALAEVTQTIYFLNSDDVLVFKRLNANSALTIHKNDYYTLETGEPQTLTGIANVTELGDNIEMSTGEGFTQYIRNNPFLELRADITTMLTTALASVGGMTIVPFICEWDGNFLLEAGDVIKLITEDDQEVTSIIANDIVTYNGIFSEVTQWTTEAREETATNPTSLGEVLKQTYAKVDKANKEITLVASSVETNKQDIASLTIDINGIKLAIESLEDATIGDFTDLTTRLAALELSNTEIKATVAENKTTVEALDGEVDALGTEVHTNTASIGVLSGTVETHSTKIGELSTSNTKISASVSSLETTTTTLTNKFGVIETDVKTIDGTVSALDEDLTALDEEVSRVDGVVTVNTEKIAALELNDESITASVTAVTERTTAIESHMGELDENLVLTQESIAALQIKDNEITASVSTVEKTTNERIDGVEENYSNISEQMSELKLTDSELTLEITNIKNDGVSKVSGIGFSFDMNGLTIDKEDSELSTNINEDGLSVYRHNDEVLTANNAGVKAYDLHATTYVTIGDRGDGEGRSKFADYGYDRTGCFWVGK